MPRQVVERGPCHFARGLLVIVEDLKTGIHLGDLQPEHFHLVLVVKHSNRDLLDVADDKHGLLLFFLTVEVIVAVFVQIGRLGHHLLLRVALILHIAGHLLHCLNVAIVQATLNL